MSRRRVLKERRRKRRGGEESDNKEEVEGFFFCWKLERRVRMRWVWKFEWWGCRRCRRCWDVFHIQLRLLGAFWNGLSALLQGWLIKSISRDSKKITLHDLIQIREFFPVFQLGIYEIISKIFSPVLRKSIACTDDLHCVIGGSNPGKLFIFLKLFSVEVWVYLFDLELWMYLRTEREI